jgi:tetratricopeptide (TPR) repeat protein
LTALGCGGDIEARMAEVRAMQDVGQFTASIDELREILVLDPDHAEASYRLGVALVQTGEPTRAIWALEKASESAEYAVPASVLLAAAHFNSQNYESTIAAADRVLERDPEHEAALRLRAQGNIGAGGLEEALADVERLLEMAPDDYGVRALYATVLGDLGRLDESEVEHDRLKQMALESGDPSIAHRGCIAPALFARDQRKNDERAEELFDDCVERFPTNGFVAGEAMRFYDRIGKPEKSTTLIRRAVEQAPENLSLRSQLATRLRNEGEADAAEQVLLEAVESFRSAGAWNLLASFYRQQGEPEKALGAIEKVAELSGGGSEQLRFIHADVLIDVGELERAEEIAAQLEEPTYAKLLRGRILLERGDPEAALVQFEEGISAWPDNAGARYLAGRAARELGDTDRAVSELRESVRADQSATRAAELLAWIHFERGEYNEALSFTRIAARRRGANFADIYLIAARALTELEKYDEARGALKNLGDLPGQEARALAELAAVERAEAGPAAALQVIESAGLALDDPANERALRAWTDLMLGQGEGEAALARLDDVLQKHSGVASYHELRGNVLLSLDRQDEAGEEFQKSVALDPEYAAGHAGLAQLAARRGDFPGAVEQFDLAAKLDPNASAYAYAAAKLAERSGDAAGAERRLEEIVRRFPREVGARNDLAWTLADRGESLNRALELAQQAQRLDPSPDVLDTLGWVHFKRGELQEAVGAFEQAIEARPESPSFRYRLGLALAAAGEADRAREMFESALEAGAFPEAEDARAQLARLQPQ